MISRTPEQKLKRLLSNFIPLGGWRTQVVLHHGLERVLGCPATILVVGSERMAGYVAQRFLSEEREVERFGYIPIWELPKYLERLQPSVDLTSITIDHLSARLLFKRNYLISPAWIGSWMPIPDDIRSLARRSSSLADDMRHLRDGHFTSVVSHSAADFDLFYNRYYAPYISKRHSSGQLLSRKEARRIFQHGCLLWIQRDGERQAGALLEYQGKILGMKILGVLDGSFELMRGGLTAAIYFHAIRHGQISGQTDVFFGGSRPSLHDGVFRFKRKWGTILCEHPGTNYESLLRWNRMDGVVAKFLSGTSIIYRDNDKLSALWVYPDDIPLTAERIMKEYKAIHVPGLSRMTILLPGDLPVDMDCPKDVHLLNYRSMPNMTPETLGLQR